MFPIGDPKCQNRCAYRTSVPSTRNEIRARFQQYVSRREKKSGNCDCAAGFARASFCLVSPPGAKIPKDAGCRFAG